MCVLVEAIDDSISNRLFDIHLKGLAGRERHTGVMDYTGCKNPRRENPGVGGKISQMGP